MENKIWVEKYRPQKLSDLVLEESSRIALSNFLKSDSIPNLLLSGAVGTGKTTISKILIQALDCDVLPLNASDERGIQVVRDKIKSFSMASNMKKWKIVFLDEADFLTIEAQAALRNMMETYSDRVRYILTANYIQKIIEPLQSRCQIIEFKNLSKKQIVGVLAKILNAEEVVFDVDDLLVVVDKMHPDVRSMINYLQLHSQDKRLVLGNVDDFRNLEKVMELLKKKDVKGLRKLDLDYTEVYRYLFDHVEDLVSDYEKIIDISVALAEYLWRETFIADKSINFAACMMVVSQKL